jgi:hypothetical protein
LFKRVLTLFIFSSLLLCPILPNTQVYAALDPLDYYKVTREPQLLNALQLIQNTSASPLLEAHVSGGHLKIMFKPMLEFGPGYVGYDALTVISPTNQQIIYINSKHAAAPPQALAALISHEMMHDDRENSLQEEVHAWHREGQTWSELKALYPELKAIPAYRVSLVDRLNAICILAQRRQLSMQIENNIAYQGLPQHSPGF